MTGDSQLANGVGLERSWLRALRWLHSRVATWSVANQMRNSDLTPSRQPAARFTTTTATAVTRGKKGPGLKGMFQHQYLPHTGLPANDDRVGDIIRNGRPDMTGYGQVLSSQDMQDLLAYLHTL